MVKDNLNPGLCPPASRCSSRRSRALTSPDMGQPPYRSSSGCSQSAAQRPGPPCGAWMLAST